MIVASLFACTPAVNAPTTVPPTIAPVTSPTTVPDTVDTGTPPTSEPIPAGPWWSCSEDPDRAVASGSVEVLRGTSFLPLCGTEILLAAADELRRVDVASRKRIEGWATAAEPTAVAVDGVANVLWLAVDGVQSVQRVDLLTGDVTEELIGEVPSGLIAVPGQWLFVQLAADGNFGMDVRFLDTTGASLGAATMTEPYGVAPWVFDPVSSVFVAGDRGLSPSGLASYRFDPIDLSLTKEQDLFNSGSNGNDLALSPDGAHLAYTVGTGNGSTYTIYDYDPTDFTTVRGEWDTDAYPSGVAFSPDGTRLLASNGTTVYLFDVETHLPIRSWEPAKCTASISKVAFSRGGTVGYAYSSCDFFDQEDGILAWFAMP